MTTDAKPMTTLPGEIAEALGRYRGSVAGAALYECATNAAVERDDRDALVAAILAYGAAALARAEAAERWQREVADGLGYLNRAEGQDGYEVAEPGVIVAAFRAAERDLAAAHAEVERLRQQILDDALCSVCQGHGTMGTGRPDAHGEGEEVGPCDACGGSGSASAEARTLKRERDEAWDERDEARRQREEIPVRCLEMRGVQLGDMCPGCSGWGVRAYGSTATWRGSIGGQMVTSDVCNVCWGSGSHSRRWPSWRVMFAADQALAAAASLRERVRALEEGLTTFLDATRFAEDLRRAIPVVGLNAARTRARALLAPTKEEP